MSWAIFTHGGPNGPSTISVGLRPTESGLVTTTTINGRQVVADPNLVKVPDFVPGLMAVVTTDAMRGEPELLKQLAASIEPEADLADRTTWKSNVWR